ncbi:MAG: hypothetical protein HRT73_10445, partial [Flavobacteriales bacterium]|nr:hypothetical protein [Flavobacteriales bacterium]
EGISYTTYSRSYYPRLGKWVSLDPLASDFPWQSPYVAFDNNPIIFTDPYGDAAGKENMKNQEGDKNGCGQIYSCGTVSADGSVNDDAGWVSA